MVSHKSAPTRRDLRQHPHRALLVELQHIARFQGRLGFGVGEFFTVELHAAPLEEPAHFAAARVGLERFRVSLENHAEHIPSEGEWQNQIANSSLFVYYSMTCLLHKFHSALISDLSIFNKCKAMVIFDRMNSFKTLIDRNMLTSKHFSPDEQPMQQAALFTLCDVSSITVNHWSTRPEDNLEQMQGLMKGTLQEGLYLGKYAL